MTASWSIQILNKWKDSVEGYVQYYEDVRIITTLLCEISVFVNDCFVYTMTIHKSVFIHPSRIQLTLPIAGFQILALTFIIERI